MVSSLSKGRKERTRLPSTVPLAASKELGSKDDTKHEISEHDQEFSRKSTSSEALLGSHLSDAQKQIEQRIYQDVALARQYQLRAGSIQQQDPVYFNAAIHALQQREALLDFDIHARLRGRTLMPAALALNTPFLKNNPVVALSHPTALALSGSISPLRLNFLNNHHAGFFRGMADAGMMVPNLPEESRTMNSKTHQQHHLPDTS